MSLREARRCWREATESVSDPIKCMPHVLRSLSALLTYFEKDSSSASSVGYDKTELGVTLQFGKYRGKTLEEVAQLDPGYLEWMLSQDFEMDLLDATEAALAGGGLNS